MPIQSSFLPSTPARPSQIENFRLLCLAASCVVGPFLGWWWPAETWTSAAGSASLGDYGLMCFLVLAAWVCIDRPRSGGVTTAVVVAAVLLLGREIAWRHSPLALAMLYATATTAVVSVVLGSFAFEARGRPLDHILTPERLVAVLVGLQLLGWTLWALV